MCPREMCSVPLCQLCQYANCANCANCASVPTVPVCQCASVPVCQLYQCANCARVPVCQLCQRVKYNLSTDFPPVASFLAVRGHFPVQVSFSISAITIQGDQINF